MQSTFYFILTRNFYYCKNMLNNEIDNNKEKKTPMSMLWALYKVIYSSTCKIQITSLNEISRNSKIQSKKNHEDTRPCSIFLLFIIMLICSCLIDLSLFGQCLYVCASSPVLPHKEQTIARKTGHIKRYPVNPGLTI